MALRVLLYVISAVEAIAGIVLIFATGWVLAFSPTVLELRYTGFVFALLKGIGIIVIALAYLLCVTARDPVRYVAVIDALIFVLLAAAALNVYAVLGLHLGGTVYPSLYLIVRAGIQIFIAAVLLALRPRTAARA